jgi:putative transposase
MDETSI